MLKSSLCDCSDAYILAKGTITVNNTGTATAPNNRNIKVKFKNCATFTECISEISNTQVNNAKDIYIVMPMYNLIEYSDNYPKTSRSLSHYCKDMPAVNNNGNIVNFNGNKPTDSFNSKAKIASQADNDGEIDNVEIMIPWKYLSNFLRALEISLINCEFNLISTWSENCVIVSTNVVNQNATFTITETKRSVPVATLSVQNNAKLLTQLK